MQAITFLAIDLAQITNFMAVNFLSTQDHMGLKTEKCATPTVFIQSQPKVIKRLATMVEYRLLLCLTIDQVLHILCHLKIFDMGLNGKIVKYARS